MSGRLKVMLSTEGTYPFHQGGVSTWCDILVKNLTDVDYFLYSIIMNPFVTQKFTLPDTASLIKVPLWGTEEPSEHLETPFSQVYLSKKRTIEPIIKDRFVPLFIELIDEVVKLDKDPKRFGQILIALHRYFQEYEYKKSFKSEAVWDIYKDYMLGFTENRKNKMTQPSIYGAIQSLGWVYRFLNILNTPIPQVHVSHAAAAAFCGIPCVLAKQQYGTPFMLTEHGVYLREQYLSLSQRGYSSYLNTFLIRLIHSVASLNYAYADQVSPVCSYNTRWEKRFGVKETVLDVIYNGVDKDVFSPKIQVKKDKNPTVVSVARVDPIKDLVTLIRAAAIVKERIPNVKFVVYGSVSVPKYFDECIALVGELRLTETFIFAGHSTDIPSAYRSGDVVALSSISEAFPYSVVEAMMCEKPVVSTDVGGIKEALGDCGILVKPRDPEGLAKGIVTLLKNPDLCASLGEQARQRALNHFTLERVLGLHMKSYIKLAVSLEQSGIRVVSIHRKKQKLYYEKGCVLLSIGHTQEAIDQFRLAVKEDTSSPAVPVILTDMADAYNNLGNYEQAFIEMEKASVLAKLLENSQSA